MSRSQSKVYKQEIPLSVGQEVTVVNTHYHHFADGSVVSFFGFDENDDTYGFIGDVGPLSDVRQWLNADQFTINFEIA